MTTTNTKQDECRALIVEGGAMRSVFSAGLLDGFLQARFNPFDFVIGVSGGACNLLSYLTGMQGRSLELYQQVANQPGFISYRRFLQGGDLLDIDWLVTYVFNQFSDLSTRLPESTPFYITATNVLSGNATFVQANSDNLQTALKASMSLPLLCRQFTPLLGAPHTDGGVSANIPLQQALLQGANRIMVVRSRPRSFEKRDSLGHRYIRFAHRHYPALRHTMRRRVELHQQTLALLQNPPAGIDLVDICPPEHFEAGRFTRNPDHLHTGYQAGLDLASQAMSAWQSGTSARL